METSQKNEYVQTATSLSCCLLLAITSIMAPFYMPLFFGIISMFGTLGAAYFIAVSNEQAKKILISVFNTIKSWLDLSPPVDPPEEVSEVKRSTGPRKRA